MPEPKRMCQLLPSLKWIWRELKIGVPIATCCGLFFGVVFRQSIYIALIYSLCTGLVIQALVEIGRYGLTYLLRKHFPDKVKTQMVWPGWGLMGPWIIIAGSAGYVGGHYIGDLITGLHRVTEIIDNPRILFLVMAIVLAVAIACVYFFYSRGRMAALEVKSEAAMRTAAENQLKMLESQLEPHMLFNTLANLRVLIGLDPPRAQEMLDRMISFLRATLEASRTGSHPLSTEFDRIHDYLDMMQVRMGQRLQFHLDLPADLAALPIPPLLMQPLVENAIKHGLEPKIQGGKIEVTAQCVDDALIINVRDNGAGLGALTSNSTNFGMQQVRERICTLYGSAAKLELVSANDKEGGTLATIHLPMSKLILSPALTET
jgi:hypothetical protein